MNFHDQRYGSAHFGGSHQIHSSELIEDRGLRFAYDGDAPLGLDSQGPKIVFAGSRSGKGSIILPNLILPRRMLGHPLRGLVHDPKGENAAISFWSQIDLGREAYAMNYYGLHDLPNHTTNQLDILTPENPRLMSDIQAILLSLLPSKHDDKQPFFKEQMRGWAEFIIYWWVLKFGKITLPELYDIINILRANSDRSDELLAAMSQCSHPDIEAVAEEMHYKRTSAPKEYSPTISTLVQALSFLNDPKVRESFDGEPDFSLSILSDPERPAVVYQCIPEDYMERLAPLTRLNFMVAKLYKSRRPESPPVYFGVDEANALKFFDLLKQLFSYGPGLNIRTDVYYQDTGQPKKHFGPEGLTSFMASAQTRQFFGIRDPETAKFISDDMLGYQTIDADDIVRQQTARRERARHALAALDSDDPVGAFMDARLQAFASQHQQKQQRLLMTPGEIMAMPAGKQVVFISEIDLPPLYVDRHPYWTRPELAGRYFPNPYQPNPHRVVLAGGRPAAVRMERVPSHLSDWPQHKSGYAKRIEGYPWGWSFAQ